MKIIAIVILFFLSGCTKPPEAENSGTVQFMRSDNGALMQNPGAAVLSTTTERKTH